MAYNSHRANHKHVKFVDTEYEYESMLPVAKTKTETREMYEGPHFPNIHMMFKQKEALPVIEEARHVAKVEQPTYKATGIVVYEEKEEDINMEAADFIKRKHHNFELQKLMSMKGEDYYTSK